MFFHITVRNEYNACAVRLKRLDLQCIKHFVLRVMMPPWDKLVKTTLRSVLSS